MYAIVFDLDATILEQTLGPRGVWHHGANDNTSRARRLERMRAENRVRARVLTVNEPGELALVDLGHGHRLGGPLGPRLFRFLNHGILHHLAGRAWQRRDAPDRGPAAHG